MPGRTQTSRYAEQSVLGCTDGEDAVIACEHLRMLDEHGFAFGLMSSNENWHVKDADSMISGLSISIIEVIAAKYSSLATYRAIKHPLRSYSQRSRSVKFSV